MMNIYNELKKDHEQVQGLIEKLSNAEAPDRRRELVSEIRDALIPHSRAEEAVLYNSLRESDKAKELVGHSYQEHLKAEALLRGLQVTETLAVKWKSGVDKLKEDLTHHIEEEQGKLFAVAKQLFSEEEAMALGRAFTELKPKMKADLISSNVELIANLMPTRLKKTFLGYFAGQGSAPRKAS